MSVHIVLVVVVVVIMVVLFVEAHIASIADDKDDNGHKDEMTTAIAICNSKIKSNVAQATHRCPGKHTVTAIDTERS